MVLWEMFEDSGNKCGKCQNHDCEVLKKGHARDCPFKKCNCQRCRLLDARSDILQVISGKESKLKGTKKDPHCGFCQNHGIKILRKGHVRSCSFGQERHFRLQDCFDCEVHYIRNEVNRLQIKMRRAMKEDRALSLEQRKTAREPITREDVEKVCDMARSARNKRESMLQQQAAESSSQSPSSNSSSAFIRQQQQQQHHHHQQVSGQHQQLQLERHLQKAVWRPWSQHEVAMNAQQHHQSQLLQQQPISQPVVATAALPVEQQQQQQQDFIGPIDLVASNHNNSNSNNSNQMQEQQLFNTLQIFRLIMESLQSNQNHNAE